VAAVFQEWRPTGRHFFCACPDAKAVFDHTLVGRIGCAHVRDAPCRLKSACYNVTASPLQLLAWRYVN
jgi:predicted nucleic acid-binding Zn finger protein